MVQFITAFICTCTTNVPCIFNIISGPNIIKLILASFTLKRSVTLISLYRLTPKFGVNYAEIGFIILGPGSRIFLLKQEYGSMADIVYLYLRVKE